MIPYRLTDFYDPEPDEERADREYDARREREVERGSVRDFTDEEWEGIRGSDFDDGDGLRRPGFSVDAGGGARHRAEADAGGAGGGQ